MAYEFKKLSDVNVIEGMKENLNVLVEDNGEIVKFAANDMIPDSVIKSVNGETPDENGNVDVSGLPEGSQPHQQLVTGADNKAVWEARTHYTTVETLFNWDGDQAGLNESNYTQMYMRYCGPFNDLNDITGGNVGWFLGTTLVTSETGGGYYYVGSQSNEFEHTVKEADIYSTGASSYGIWGNGAQTPIVWVSEEDVGTTIQLYSSADGSSTYPCTFTSSGFWIGKYNTSPGVAAIEYRDTTTLPENYLPPPSPSSSPHRSARPSLLRR